MAHASFPEPLFPIFPWFPQHPSFPGYPSAPPLPQFPPGSPIPPPPPPSPCFPALARAFSNWGGPAQNSRPCCASQSEQGPYLGPPPGPPPTGMVQCTFLTRSGILQRQPSPAPLLWQPVNRVWHCPQMSPPLRLEQWGSLRADHMCCSPFVQHWVLTVPTDGIPGWAGGLATLRATSATSVAETTCSPRIRGSSCMGCVGWGQGSGWAVGSTMGGGVPGGSRFPAQVLFR